MVFEKKLGQVGAFLDDRGLQLGLTTSSLVFGVAIKTIISSDWERFQPSLEDHRVWWGIALLVSGFSICVFSFWQWQKDTKISDLKEKERELQGKIDYMQANFPDVVSQYLGMVSRQLKWSERERISLYQVSELEPGKEIFERIGRYSENVHYNVSGSRVIHSDIGFIAEAWKEGSFSTIDELPDPQADEQEYYQAVKGLCKKFTKGAFDTIRMRSRSYYIERIYNHGVPTGIIVFESLDPTTVNEDEIKKLMGRLREGLELMLEQMNPTKPKLSVAREAGF